MQQIAEEKREKKYENNKYKQVEVRERERELI
jgi:hypothetical protein